MDQLDDMELVRNYAENSSEEAFAVLVSRYVDMVHSAALRQVRDPHLAEEIAQTVFVLLARKARSLTRGTILAGWLHRATRFTASDALRAQRRRILRETHAMDELASIQQDKSWQDIEPLLDEALESLGDQDRQALLLRYFRKLSLRDLGQRLGITEDAAQKRVARAVDRLRDLFVRRGATLSASALAAMLGAHAVQAAPAAVTAAIVATASGAAAGFASSSLYLLQEIADLGNAYPPAREALRIRRDTLQARLNPGSSDAYQILELTALNEKLNEPQKNVDLAAQLERDSPARSIIYKGVADLLIAEQRYAELINIAPPEEIYRHQVTTIESTQKSLAGMPTAALAEEGLRRNLIKTGVAGVEALAGAGYPERALAMARQILSANGTPDTRQQLIERAHRANDRELAQALTENSSD